MTAREAAKSLHALLVTYPFTLQTGVGYNDGESPELYVYLEKKSQKKDVPDTWEGFKVNKVVTGKIRPLAAT